MSVEPSPVDTLVRDALAGDETAFASLAQRSRPAIHRLCVGIVGPDDADDAVQETLIRAWRRLGTYEGRSSFEAWLGAIARRTCIDALRRRRRTPEPRSEVAERPAEATPDPASVVATRDEVERAVLHVVRSLPRQQAAVLVLRRSLRLSASETAELMSCSSASVNSALYRATAAVPHIPRPERTLARGRGHEHVRARQLVDANASGDALGVMTALCAGM
jgi:RNA polymerase sigma-70 factor (ECF subfamily)